MKSRMRSTVLTADMFKYSKLPNETTISAADYTALVKAAIAKGKFAELLTWQRNRKIILKG